MASNGVFFMSIIICNEYYAKNWGNLVPNKHIVYAYFFLQTFPKYLDSLLERSNNWIDAMVEHNVIANFESIL